MMEKTDQSSTSPPNRNPDHVHAIGEEAGALLGEARQKGGEQLEHYRDSAADQLDSSRKAHGRLQRPWKAMTALACRAT